MAPRPLAGVRVVEVVRPDCAGITAVAVAFAGRMVAALGGEVTRVLAGGVDPLASWPPLLPDGSSALHRFLNDAKTTAPAVPTAAGSLLTDDPALAAGWSGGSTVLVVSSQESPAIAHSELTILAASGLLDIYGDRDAPPLPLPGHQAAYAAGIAAFNAFICAHYARAAGQPFSHSRVSVLDVAFWLNWKHYLAAYLDLPNTGVGRAEEWRTYRCRDGYIAFVFQDKDLGKIAVLTGDARFTEPRFATQNARRENIDAFCRLIADWAGGQTRDAIVARAAGMGLPIGPVLAVGELLDDAQMLARGFIDLARGSPTFGHPRLPAVWTASAPDAAPRHSAPSPRQRPPP